VRAPSTHSDSTLSEGIPPTLTVSLSLEELRYRITKVGFTHLSQYGMKHLVVLENKVFKRLNPVRNEGSSSRG